MKRALKAIAHHGRSGHPLIHVAATGARYIMIRKKGGGTKRLYEGSKHAVDRPGKKIRRLRLG